ncbi:hypothetical protein [Parafrankia sp. FMc2]|uniref:hypothetical protein n=1 Tax=Parafrankia sp. FMc2 TaxID=3233196 RepID=UPI0034D4E8EB
MATPTRAKRTYPRNGGGPEHHWMLAGSSGVLTFCVIECTDPTLAHAIVDGTPWMSWGIDAHIPANRCADVRPGHSHGDMDGGCGLLDGVPCCIRNTWSSDGRELLGRWIAGGRDDELIWAELERRWPDLVTANAKDEVA